MLGTIGTVKKVHEDGDVVIVIDNHIWMVNPAVLTLHEASKKDDDDDDDDDGEGIKIDLGDQLAGLLTLKCKRIIECGTDRISYLSYYCLLSSCIYHHHHHHNY